MLIVRTANFHCFHILLFVSVKENPEPDSTGNINLRCTLYHRLPYIQRESEKATRWKARGDLQLCPKAIYTDVMGEGGRKESAC